MLLLLAALPASGCSHDGDRCAVSGTVALDGKPLESGAINFRPAAGEKGKGSGGSITNGNFEIGKEKGLEAGKYKVTVQAFRPTGRMVKDPQFGKVPQTVAVRFREANSLEAEITSTGANRFEFKLTSVR